MQIAAVHGERRAGVVEVPIPEPKGDWALVKIHAAPMCTEVKVWLAGNRVPLGHEAAGDLVAWRRNRAKQLGADLTLDAASDTLRDEIRERTGGLGVDAAIDCSGSPVAQRLCIDAVRRRGRVAFVGQTRTPIEVHPSRDLLANGLTVMGSWHYNLNLYPELMQLIERSDLLDTLISHTFPLTGVQQAFEATATQEAAKVILHPWA
jgi:threonine dehydrogenase-like Zn-dependent dehydrogenase